MQTLSGSPKQESEKFMDKSIKWLEGLDREVSSEVPGVFIGVLMEYKRKLIANND